MTEWEENRIWEALELLREIRDLLKPPAPEISQRPGSLEYVPGNLKYVPEPEWIGCENCHHAPDTLCTCFCHIQRQK